MQVLWVDALASVRGSKGFGAARPLTPSETLNPKPEIGIPICCSTLLCWLGNTPVLTKL